ncbi:WGxxGxxG family protein [Paenibacillus sp. FSL H7-0350]|uniref:WGxxGxxG family protein n=1 Tax=Paenibacillus sp. FSL H7-0350 TaxID=2975345 RepID=UPI0031584E9E
MNKLITSLACGTVLSMSLLGAGDISAAPGGMMTTTPGVMSTSAPGMNSTTTDGRMGNMNMRDMDDRTMDNRGNTLMNETRDSMHKTESIMKDKIRTGDNSSVSPLSNNNTTGRYRAQSTTTTATNNGNRSNWGWLGLVGLLGLAGMRSRTGERDRH